MPVGSRMPRSASSSRLCESGMAASDFVTETKGTLPSSDPYNYYYIVCFLLQ